jgi:hypothetical protein
MLTIRALEPVDVARQGAIFRQINGEVVPGLRAAIRDLQLPDTIGLRNVAPGAENHVALSFDDESAAITRISDPVLLIDPSDVRTRWAAAHELAHFHELSQRRRHNIRLPSVRASMLWSEYFAQRVCWSTGFVDADKLIPGGGPAGENAHRKTQGESPGAAYYLAWVKGHLDAVPSAVEAYPAEFHTYLTTILQSEGVTMCDRLFKRFPQWDELDIEYARLTFEFFDTLERLLNRA